MTQTILMAHGSGGAETADLIRRVFASRIGNASLNLMEDAAILRSQGKLAFTTDSYVVDPLFFRGGDIGNLAVYGTANDLSVMGARPTALSAGFILEEGLPLSTLERVADSMAEAARRLRIKIVAADTKVVPGKGGLYINTSGLGEVRGRSVSLRAARTGDALLVSGTLGDHHACILSARMGVENDIRSDVGPLWPLVTRLQEARIPLHGMRDITRGGLGTILNEVASAASCGVEIIEDALPVSDSVRGLCDLLGLDPLYMGNEGKLLAVVPETHAARALALLRAHPAGRRAARIGTITPGAGVVMRTQLGGLRCIDAMRGEGLPRIC